MRRHCVKPILALRWDIKEPMQLRTVLGVVPILIAIGLAVLLVSLRSGPKRVESAGEQARVVRVYTAKRLDVVPRVLGYGSVRPARIFALLNVCSPSVNDRGKG